VTATGLDVEVEREEEVGTDRGTDRGRGRAEGGVEVFEDDEDTAILSVCA
jgi:hypothetical protein